MTLSPVIQIARPDHWFKNVFMLPGVVLYLFFYGWVDGGVFALRLLLALVSICLVASANYVLNEILDAPQDRYHPRKKSRPLPSGQISLRAAYLEWGVLASAGLGVAGLLGVRFLGWALALWIMGLIYNVPPLRTKRICHADVLSESVNNPIRLALGWYAVGSNGVPPLSFFIAYWMFGAFLMAAKRFAELRMIGDVAVARQYRESLGRYTEQSLLVAMFFYVALFAMMAGIFIARYHVELILATPFIALAMAAYLRLSFEPDSPVQNPEHLYRVKGLMAIVGVAFLLCCVLLFVDLPWVRDLFAPWISPQ